MKIDGRTIGRKKAEEIRFEAVKRVQSGERATDVAEDMGFHKSVIFTWLSAYRNGGWHALLSRKGKGRPKKLDAKQIKWIYDTVATKTPLQLNFPFALWTREQIKDLIYRKFKIKLSVASVSRLMAQLGLSPQKPLYRAYEQNPELVDRWIAEDYPAIKAQAKREKAEIFFEDEAGIRSDHHSGTTWAKKGKTPIVRVTGARYSLNMISAISPRGTLRFMIFKGSFNQDVLIVFLKRLMVGQRRPIFLIVDGHPSHKAKRVRDYIASLNGKLKIFILPPYSPELNPDEQVWNEVKNHNVGKTQIFSFSDLKRAVRRGLRKLQMRPDSVRAFFRHKDCKYAAA